MAKSKSKITDEMRAAADELYHGDTICKEKSQFLLSEVGLPNGLLPLKDIEETGYIKETGFVWLIQKEKSQHRFDQIDRLVQYAREVTAYVEPGKIKKLTGVKTREMLLWINIREIDLDDPPTGNINFRVASGMSRSFPVEAFQLEEGSANISIPVDIDEDAGEDDEEDAEVSTTLSTQDVKAGATLEVKEA